MKNIQIANELVRIAKLVKSSIPNFSRFVDEYEVDDYPYGRERTKAVYKVERKGNKARVCRMTLDPKSGRWNKPKCTTFGPAATIGIAPNGHAYPIVGRPGQIAVWSGDMKHTEGAVFADDSQYNDLAKALEFRQVPGKITVKETSDGAEVDGLQGKKTSPREIMNHAGIPNEVIDSDVKNVRRKPSKDYMSEDWIIEFKPEADRKPFVIKLYT